MRAHPLQPQWRLIIAGVRAYDAPSAVLPSPSATMMSSAFLRPAALSVLRHSTRLAAHPRSFHASCARRLPAPDGGLTNILSGGEAPAVQVKTVSPKGIQLSDGLILPSACIFLDGKVFLWNVPAKPWDGWKQEHFEIFETVVPKPGQLLRVSRLRVPRHESICLYRDSPCWHRRESGDDASVFAAVFE